MSNKKNHIEVDGDGNIILQDVEGKNININDIKKIKEVFETTEPEYIQELYTELQEKYKILIEANAQQTKQLSDFFNSIAEKEKIKTDKDFLKKLISENRINEIFNILENSISNNNSFIMIKSQWKDMKDREMMGLISFSELNIEKNKIKYSLLQLISQI